ncbi:unnamed protein product [Scytosiphon promiscuus]
MIAATRYPAFSRNFEDEQDYADAAVRGKSPLSGVNLSPILRWKRQQHQKEHQQRDSSSAGPKKKLRCKTLIVGFEGGGASFAHKCFGLAVDDGSTDGAEWVGTVLLPGAPPLGGDGGGSVGVGGTGIASTTAGLGDSLDPADPLNSACNIFYRKRRGAETEAGGEKRGESSSSDGVERGGGNSNGSLSNGGLGEADSKTDAGITADTNINTIDGDVGGGDVIGGCNGDGVAVVLCGYRVPPRQADAWAKALLGGIDADVVIALTTVTAEPGRSEGWRGARLLATSEAEEREDCLKMSVGFQPLRTPTMLSGASAALVSYCQRHGRAAMCFAAAESPGRRALPQQQFGDAGVAGVSGRSGDKSLLLAERHLSCTRQALGVLAAEAMVGSPKDGDAGGMRGMEAEIDGATSSLYV